MLQYNTNWLPDLISHSPIPHPPLAFVALFLFAAPTEKGRQFIRFRSSSSHHPEVDLLIPFLLSQIPPPSSSSCRCSRWLASSSIQWLLGSVQGLTPADRVGAESCAHFALLLPGPEQWFGSKKVVGLLGWISSRNGGAPGAVPGLLVRAGGLGGRGLPGVRGLRRAPLTRRPLPRRPIPPRPTRLRGNQLLSCMLEVLGSEVPVLGCVISPSRIVVCCGWTAFVWINLVWCGCFWNCSGIA